MLSGTRSGRCLVVFNQIIESFWHAWCLLVLLAVSFLFAFYNFLGCYVFLCYTNKTHVSCYYYLRKCSTTQRQVWCRPFLLYLKHITEKKIQSQSFAEQGIDSVVCLLPFYVAVLFQFIECLCTPGPRQGATNSKAGGKQRKCSKG